MHFDTRAIEAQTIHGHADHVVFLKRVEQPVQNARIRPTAHPCVDSVPIAKPRWKCPPFAAVLGNKKDGVNDREIGNPHISPLDWKMGRYQGVLLSVISFITDS